MGVREDGIMMTLSGLVMLSLSVSALALYLEGNFKGAANMIVLCIFPLISLIKYDRGGYK